jgi:Domain of unknown function (DUF4226)
MSEPGWDVISTVVGGVLGTVVGGPIGGAIGGVLGAAEGGLFDEPSPPQHVPSPTAPPPGGQVPAPPGVLPAPPATDPDGSGKAADAGSADSQSVAQVIAQLAELDKSAADTVDAIHAEGEAGRQALDGIQRDVDAKITELGPRLNTPAGQKELRDFLKEKLQSAKQVLDQQIADAEAKARKAHELTQQYADLGARPDGSGNGDGGDGSGGGSGRSGGGGTSPGDAGTTPAAAPPPGPAAPVSPLGPGSMMPGAPMMPAGMPLASIPSFPSFGGGGVPGLGGGDPLSALSGLGGAPQFHDGTGSGDDPGSRDGDPLKLHDQHDQDGNGAGSGGDDTSGGHTGTESDSDHSGSGGTHSAVDHGGTDPGHPGGDPAGGTGTDIKLPDGTSAEARNDHGAAAVRAALNGATVSDAYQQSGITVPPAGTPVTDPVPPTQLKAGDVGVWKDHLAMALGNAKVLVSGQVQPLSSVGSGPDFLGWMDPTAGAKGSPPAPHTDPANPAPNATES